MKMLRIRHALVAAVVMCLPPVHAADTDERGAWQGDLAPIATTQWNYDRAAHLLERAGFGGTPADIERLVALGPEGAVDSLVRFSAADAEALPAFDESGAFDPGLDPFPPSRPAATELAKKTGESLGVKVKPSGPRRLQPVADKFFYWLRASRLETDRIVYWWADRMLRSPKPLQEKLALFWHGHFATNEDKVRDYRKMLRQVQLFERQGGGNFRDLLVAVAQDPAMLAFLDAGVNVKGAPNENFAREIMELFSLGVGNYTERDIREAARAFTGWNFRGVEFVVNADRHDGGTKAFLGRSGAFDGVDVIDIIMSQPVCADFVATKLYRFFVRDDVSPELRARLGERFRANGYAVAPFLREVFLSRDFYSPASLGTHIKGPVELVVSTYRKLGLREVPGVPDFNVITTALGQHLLQPPTVAGWSQGRSWVTPGLLIERGNFARDVLFPDINFIPPDRYSPDPKIRAVADKLALGEDITSATQERDMQSDDMAMSNKMAGQDEDFNTRYASYRGWQLAIERVKPIPRRPAQPDLTGMVVQAKCRSAEDVVDLFLKRFVTVRVSESERARLAEYLRREAGTDDIAAATSFLDDPLRRLLHAIMSLPEYQLG
jgi:uncharacterized protein (DUF1800 family)